MVRRAHEPGLSQVEDSTSKKPRMTAFAGPQLARGRPENLILSRGCTPSDEEMEPFDETDTASTWSQTDHVHEPSSSICGGLGGAATPLTRNASAFLPLNGPLVGRAGSRSRGAKTERQDSEDQSLMSISEESQEDDTEPENTSDHDYPSSALPNQPRTTRHDSSLFPRLFQDMTTTATTTSPATNRERRASESGFRPIAKMPPNYRRDSDILDIQKRLGRTAIGKGKGIKPAYKNQEERDKVKAVRTVGACLRCKIMRQPCEVTEPGQPCSKCKVVRRKFSLPCTKIGPGKRARFLFPEFVTSRHGCTNQKVIYSMEMPGMFRIPLTHEAGFALNLQVLEDSNIPESDLLKPCFGQEGLGKETVARLYEDRCIPLVPIVTTAFDDVADWLEIQVNKINTELKLNRPAKVFPPVKGQHWPRAVLELFEEFQEKVYQSQRLDTVLKTLIVRHLISRRFYVPFEQIWQVNKKLSAKYQETDEQLDMRVKHQICMVPTFVNKYLKSALFRLLKRSLERDFEELELIFKLQEKSPGAEITDLDRDEAFCYLGTILILVAIMQIKIVQIAIARDKEASKVCPFEPQVQTLRQAKDVVRNIEVEVIDHILGLWTYKFIKSKRKGELKEEQRVPAQRAIRFQLFDRFEQTRVEHADILSPYTDLALDLSDEHLDRWLIDNPTRVLLRFAETIKTRPPRR